MDRDRVFHIRAELSGQTLAAALKRLLGAGLSWGEANRLVAKRHITVNGNLCVDAARRLKAGEVLHVFANPRTKVPTEQDVDVVYRDADLIVVDKPAGVTTLRHAEERKWDERRKQRQPTLDELVQKLVAGETARTAVGKRLAKRRPHAGIQHRVPPPPSPPSSRPPRVRPVHRLDRDTSGLMLFALSPRAEQALVAMFKGHSIHRVYQAVALGEVAEGRIESWLVRDRGDGLRGSSARGKDDPEAQHAVTHVKPLRKILAADGSAYTLVECRLETGRTHQIRIHLSESGHVLCGEKVYVKPAAGKPPAVDRSAAPRQALHSAGVEFVHPVSGKRLAFQAPWPKDLEGWLRRLEGKDK